MEPLRIVFMGTPDFSVPTLEALLEGPHQVVGVFCQPDKAKGRGKQLQHPPTKEVALRYDVPVYQPQSLQGEDMEALFQELAPDIIVVIAYGKILPPWLIHFPRLGCLNLHASILPKYRGPAPIHYAILQEDTHTGMTIMDMNEGLDTGDILTIEEMEILPGETTGELFDRMATLGGAMINAVVDARAKGELVGTPQREEDAVYTKKITKDMGHINWSEPAHVIGAKIRGLHPSPGCFTFFQGKRLKVHKGAVVDSAGSIAGQEVGTVVHLGEDHFSVLTGEGLLGIYEVQPENKKRMSSSDFMRGYQLQVGMKFHED